MGISRLKQDEYAMHSQHLTEKSQPNGFWEREIVPVILPPTGSVNHLYRRAHAQPWESPTMQVPVRQAASVDAA